MKTKDFFEHLNIFFKNEEDDKPLEDENEQESAPIPAFVYRNKRGKIEEIRVLNHKYDEFFYFNVDQTFGCVNIIEEEENKK